MAQVQRFRQAQGLPACWPFGPRPAQMATDYAQVALVLAIVNAVGIIAGGTYGFISKGSKISLIASTFCGAVLVALAELGQWIPTAVWAALLCVMFLQKAVKAKSGGGAGSEALLEGEQRIMKPSFAIPAVLAVIGVVVVVVSLLAAQ
mmetsp:Transcript_89386/g.193487  ORF Transcript_89386/g.193487 Transcript_89386/m.193487 type:complete len:148 (-) Transcript_89386:42-485(-)